MRGSHDAGSASAHEQPHNRERDVIQRPDDRTDSRAFGADGSGYTSNVIEAIDWAIDNRRAWNIRVVNISLGHPIVESEQDDPLCQAVQRATDAGILVTVAAGNGISNADGDGGPAVAAGVLDPRSIALDAAGNL